MWLPGQLPGLLALALGASLGAIVAQAQDCSASNPCTTGCCSKFGFCGLGPDYCKPEICVADCDRKAECDPGGYGPGYVEATACPLNACCSRWGFCGVTPEFCGPRERFVRPSCAVDENARFGRVVGYYEGESLRRLCNKFYPEQIPEGIYTHLNFAFVGIHPETFEVVPDSQWDEDPYKRLTNLKKKDPSLKVFITVGGWDFNNLGQTATTFSDLAASVSAQRSFAKSLLSFMATYHFDGVDIDWEYPGAPDRFGREADYVNFPIFIENLRVALRASGGRDGLSVALPASYKYLKYFDIRKLAASVDFFNIMAYDLHGVPAREPHPTSFHLNAHTNLTEIRPALDLFWRNGISPDKVTLGLAFHGRGFTARSRTCLAPGCPFESGASAFRCTREVGLAMNSEIDELVRVRPVKETLDEAAAVKIVTFDGDQWMAYEDGETLRRKADLARSQCLGGVAVWAVTHDTKEGKYSRLLGDVARRRYDALVRGADGYDEVVEYEDYCRWTCCNEDCPGSWFRILDHSSPSPSPLLDPTGCAGHGQHRFCCPSTTHPPPTCFWSSASSGCPPETTPITHPPLSPPLHGQHRQQLPLQHPTPRTACCHASPLIPDPSSWPPAEGDASCAWYSALSQTSAFHPADFCHANCPRDLLPVAMDTEGCEGGGARVRCCARPRKKAGEGDGDGLFFGITEDELEGYLKAFLESAAAQGGGS